MAQPRSNANDSSPGLDRFSALRNQSGRAADWGQCPSSALSSAGEQRAVAWTPEEEAATASPLAGATPFRSPPTVSASNTRCESHPARTRPNASGAVPVIRRIRMLTGDLPRLAEAIIAVRQPWSPRSRAKLAACPYAPHAMSAPRRQRKSWRQQETSSGSWSGPFRKAGYATGRTITTPAFGYRSNF